MQDDPQSTLHALSVPVYATLALWGLLDCFFGFRIFRFTIALLVGCIGGLVLAYAGFIWGDGSLVWAASGLFIGTLLGALLAWSFVVFGAVLFGGLLGWSYLQPVAHYVPPDSQLLFITLGSILIGILAGLLLEPMIRVTTAYTGAFRAVFGAYFFAEGPDFLGLSTRGVTDFSLLREFPVPFIFCIILGSLGLWYQWPRRRAKLED